MSVSNIIRQTLFFSALRLITKSAVKTVIIEYDSAERQSTKTLYLKML